MNGQERRAGLCFIDPKFASQRFNFPGFDEFMFYILTVSFRALRACRLPIHLCFVDWRDVTGGMSSSRKHFILLVPSVSHLWAFCSCLYCLVLGWVFSEFIPYFFPDNFLPFVNAFDCYSQAGWYLERVISVSFRSWRKDTLSISRMQALLPISQKKYYICFGVSQKRKNKTRISLYPFLLLLPKYYYYYH